MSNEAYQSAGLSIPIKLIKDANVLRYARLGFIVPAHVQIAPTNRCNANCSFCSYAGRDKSKEIPFAELKTAVEDFAALGTRAVTITGGGEPTLYPQFNALLELLQKNNIEVALTTNGLKLSVAMLEKMRSLRWMRISISDEYDFGVLRNTLEFATKELTTTDVNISYVITANPNKDKIREAIDFVGRFNLSHCRFVTDINDSEPLEIETDNPKIIVQQRQEFTRGSQRCLISLLKPFINADGAIYPCCGVQYATASESAKRNVSDRYIMGGLKDISEIWRNQICFDGSICEKCFYDSYNSTLSKLITPIKHEKFI